jgi:hypothetical protein
MKVLQTGTRIELGDGEISAVVLACCIRGDLVTYEVAWYDGGARHEAWVQEQEIETEARGRTVGFYPSEATS